MPQASGRWHRPQRPGFTFYFRTTGRYMRLTEDQKALLSAGSTLLKRVVYLELLRTPPRTWSAADRRFAFRFVREHVMQPQTKAAQ